MTRSRLVAAVHMILVPVAGCFMIDCASAGQRHGPGQCPSLVFATYFGGELEDTLRDVAIDAQGNIYVTGGTESPDFPTTTGAYDRTFNGWHDVYVAKFDPLGSLVWSTFLGGPNYDRAYAIEVGADGSVYVAGRAGDFFPTTAGVVQPVFAGDVNPNGAYGTQDGFVARIAPDGSAILWATYFGTDDRDFIRDIDLDADGNVYIAQPNVGRPHPHITLNAYQQEPAGGYDMVVAKISADGSTVLYATFLGGSGDDGFGPAIRVDAQGSAFVLGSGTSTDMPTTPGAYDRTYNGGLDLHVAKISPDGSQLIYATYLGGSGNDGTETHELAIDSLGHAYVSTGVKSSDFPTTAGAFQTSYGGSGGPGTGQGTNYPGDVIVAKLSPDGSQLLAATYVGGRWGEGAEGIAVDEAGNVFISGATYSDDFPVTPYAFQPALAGSADFFVAKLTGDLTQLSYATYLGGSDIDYGRTSWAGDAGSLVVGGSTISGDWPVLNAHQQDRGGYSDGAIALFSFNEPQGPPCDAAVPTVSAWGIVILAMLGLTAGTVIFTRRAAVVV